MSKKKEAWYCLTNKSSLNISPYHYREAQVAVMNPVVTGSVCSRNVTVVVLAAAMGIETSLAHLLYAGSVVLSL